MPISASISFEDTFSHTTGAARLLLLLLLLPTMRSCAVQVIQEHFSKSIVVEAWSLVYNTLRRYKAKPFALHLTNQYTAIN
jgi:hypothetical protein